LDLRNLALLNTHSGNANANSDVHEYRFTKLNHGDAMAILATMPSSHRPVLSLST
jgi:hypothetical protein